MRRGAPRVWTARIGSFLTVNRVEKRSVRELFDGQGTEAHLTGEHRGSGGRLMNRPAWLAVAGRLDSR